MKILFIHQFFSTEDEPGEVRHIAMFKHMLEKGFEFTVIGGALDYLSGKHYSDFKGIFQEKDLVPGKIKLIRSYVSPTYRKGFLGKIFCYITFLLTSVFMSIKIGQCDLLLTTSPSLLTALAGYIISLLKGVPFVLEVRDLWPKAAVEMGMVKNKFLIWLASWLELFLYEKASRIIVITQGYADYIVSRGINEGKISIVHNGVDEWMLDYPEDEGIPGELEEFSGKFVVMHVGAMGKFNHLHELLQSVELLKDKDKFAFLFVGDGAERENLKKYAEEKHLSNVCFLGTKQKKDIPSYLNRADLTVAIYPHIPTGKVLLQNKVLDYLAMGKPVVLVAQKGDTSKIIEEGQCGFVLEESGQMLAEKLEWSLENKDICREMGKRGRDYVRIHFNRKKLADEMTRILGVELL